MSVADTHLGYKSVYKEYLYILLVDVSPYANWCALLLDAERVE